MYLEWLRTESRLPPDSLKREEQSAGLLLRKLTFSRLDLMPDNSSGNRWRFFGGKGGGKLSIVALKK